MATSSVEDVARDLRQARDPSSAALGGRGRAVLLVGAGCSASAGIETAAGVARSCARYLAAQYGRGWSGREDLSSDWDETDADASLQWLFENGHVEAREKDARKDSYDWGALYSEFFEKHIKSPNAQRDVIAQVVSKNGDRLNWTHACIGELVARRVVHTVLTTNFDQLVLKGIVRADEYPVIADGLFAFNRILGQPLVPQVVHLHGSMHTYNLRNSRQAVKGTSDDQGTLAMIHTLLQQCNVFVVVGYAGGEEGLMEILIEASRHLDELVIYWVVREGDALSENAKTLLDGQNKFVVTTSDSDKFFYDLLSAMGIGAPNWIGDPVRATAMRRATIAPVNAAHFANEIIDAYGRQLDRSVAAVDERGGPTEAYHRALSHHIGAEYANVIQLLNEDATSARHEGDVEEQTVVRLRATAALELAQRGSGLDATRLRMAIKDFRSLLDREIGSPQVEDLLQSNKAMQLLAERRETNEGSDAEAAANAELIDRTVETFLTKARADGVKIDHRHRTQLLYDQANARNQLLDAQTKTIANLTSKQRDQGTPTVPIETTEARRARRERYEKVVDLYEEAITFAGHHELEGRTTLELREGQAGALQAIAAMDLDDDDEGEKRRRFASRAVDQLEKVRRSTQRPMDSADYANLLYNIATALSVQWDVSAEVQQGALRRRCLDAATTAADAYEQFRDGADRDETEKRRDEMVQLIVKFRDG